MLAAEAQWFADRVQRFSAGDLAPMGNIGSGDGRYRRDVQPWIAGRLFTPQRERELRVTHVERFAAPGVDVAGDLGEERFLTQLEQAGFQSVMCANVLEHVPDPSALARRLTRMVPPGGRLFVSVPCRFPYHPDPIDALFRPTPEALAGLFPDVEVEHAALVACGTLAHYLAGRAKHPWVLATALWSSLRATSPRSKPPREVGVHVESASVWRYAPWLFRRFTVSCVVLRRIR